MPIMEVIANEALSAATLFDPIETQSVLTPEERELVAARLRAVAMQLDRGQWGLAHAGLRELVSQITCDARTTLEDHTDPKRVTLVDLRLSTKARTYLEEAGVETLDDLRRVGDAWLHACRGISVETIREIRSADRRWSATQPERCRLARLKLRGTKFATRYKTP